MQQKAHAASCQASFPGAACLVIEHAGASRLYRRLGFAVVSDDGL
ncbi:hypothetical protein [Janthinobacterium psychrotolerans]|nr:hypothetical protein [Janthinobacterium psychrotolerans]